MIRKSFLISLLLLICSLSLFVSCKKCVTCKAYDRTDNTIKSQEDYCGPGIDVDESEKNFIYINNNTLTFAECK